MEFDKSIRKLRKIDKGDAFIHRKCVPLDKAVADEDKGQEFLFDECGGFCGV